MEIQDLITHHFVKSEDLNHHGTLYAGRTAEWFVEAGLMAAAMHLPVQNIVCVKIHSMIFTRPIRLGETVKFMSKIVHTGRTSLIASIRLDVNDKEVLNGFITFVNVDADGKSTPHGIVVETVSAQDKALQEKAKNLPKE